MPQAEKLDTSHKPSMAEPRQLLTTVALSFAVLGVLVLAGLLWTRGQRILGNDSFAYLEYAKEFMHHAPNRFGTWWPFGYPLLGSLGSLLTGLLPHTALFLVSLLAFGAIIAGCFFILRGTEGSLGTGFLLVLALACAPVCPLLLFGTMSEPLFSAALFWLAISMAFWPKPGAMACSFALALVAFCARYAGIFALGVLALYGVMQFDRLRRERRLAWLGTLFSVCLVAVLGLLYSNYRYWGHATGPQPVGRESLLSWPVHFADFGWSPIGAFVSGSLLKAAGGITQWPAFGLGCLGTMLMLMVCFQAWRRSAGQFGRPLALVAAAYILSIITLRATTPFDALSSGRAFLPVLFPLGLLSFEALVARASTWVIVTACSSIVLSLALASRGISKETYGAVGEAETILAVQLTQQATVAVNDPACSLAAYFANRFYGVRTNDWKPGAYDFTVIAARRTGRAGEQTQFEPNWLRLISDAVQTRAAALVASNANFVILRSVPAKP